MDKKSLWLDLAAALAIGGAACGAWHVAQQPGWLHKALACVLAYAALRIAYEMTVNRRSVPTIASAPAVRRQVAALVAEDFERRGGAPYEIVDLGSGRGELALAIAKGVPGARVTGIELALVPHWRAKLRQRLLGPGNLQFRRGDFFACDCHAANAAVLFLGKLTVPAGIKLAKELAPGSLVISNDFELGPGWGVPETLVLRTPFRTVLYIYRR